jgi:hypothetical protein
MVARSVDGMTIGSPVEDVMGGGLCRRAGTHRCRITPPVSLSSDRGEMLSFVFMVQLSSRGG